MFASSLVLRIEYLIITLPYLTLPYLTLPYLTLPYLTLPVGRMPALGRHRVLRGWVGSIDRWVA